MNSITYQFGGTDRLGTYDLEADTAACENGDVQEITMPHGERGARAYGYSHGGAEFRALMDAIYAREGEDAILDGRSVARFGRTRAEFLADSARLS